MPELETNYKYQDIEHIIINVYAQLDKWNPERNTKYDIKVIVIKSLKHNDWYSSKEEKTIH